MALYNLSNLPFLRIKYTLQANREGSSQSQTYKSIMKNVFSFFFWRIKRMKPLIQACVSLCPCTWGPVYTGEITSRINHNSYKQSQIQESHGTNTWVQKDFTLIFNCIWKMWAFKWNSYNLNSNHIRVSTALIILFYTAWLTSSFILTLIVSYRLIGYSTDSPT